MPDTQALVVTLEVEERETDTVGESVEKKELDVETLLVPLNVGLEVSEAEMLVVVHTVFVTLPVLETEIVGLKVTEVQPETVPVEQILVVVDTVGELVWLKLSEEVIVTDGEKDRVRVPDPQELTVPLLVVECELDTVEE